MYGGGGNDTAGGGPGSNKFFGGAGNARLSGGDGEDVIHGEAGDDIDLDGDAGNDLIYGGTGNDGSAPTSDNLRNRGLRGEGGENQVYGNEGADTIDAQTSGELGSRSSAAMGTTPSLRLMGWSTKSTAARASTTQSSLTIRDSTYC